MASGIDVRQKLRLMLYELDSIKMTLRNAAQRGRYASPFRLPADEWGRSYEELSKHPELDDVLDKVKRAYEVAHQFNEVVGPRLQEDLRIHHSDAIDDVLIAVTAAGAALRNEIDRRTPR